MIIIYFLIGFLPIISLGVVFYSQTSNIINARQYDNYNNYVTQFTSTLNNQVNVYDNLMNYIVYNQSISRTVSDSYESDYDQYKQITDSLDPIFSSLKYLHSDIKVLSIYTDNITVNHGDTIMPIKNISNKPWYKSVLSSTDTKWIFDANTKKIIAAKKMPLLNRANINSVLIMEINRDSLFSNFKGANDDNFGIFILDGNKNVVFDYQKFQTENRKYRLNYQKVKNIDKSKYITIKDQSNKLEWQMLLYYPTSFDSSKVKGIIIIIMLILLLFMLATLLAIIFTSKLITGRIKNLEKNINQVEEGNFDVVVVSDDKDEIGGLIRGFSHMVSELKYLIEEVYESKLHQKEYEMRALQQQINPHFLYNTLSMINFKALEVGEEDISRVTLALSAFYRTSLNRGKNYCSIDAELNNMRSYLSIQEIMHDYNFDVEIDIDEKIRKYETINLILQPIVENSIVHGIDLLEDRKGKIKIYATEDDEGIYIMVEDNGIGMEKKVMERMLSQNSKGYGIRNVNERIKLYYGQEYGLHVESVIGSGTLVTVYLPKKVYEGDK